MKSQLTLGAILLLLLGLFSSAVAAHPELEQVTPKKIGEGLEVTLTGENLSNPREVWAIGNTSYIVEFDGILRMKQGKQWLGKYGHAGVNYVQQVQYTSKPPKCRVHLKVKNGVKPILTEEDGKYVIRVNLPVPTEKVTVPTVATADEIAMQTAIKQLKAVQAYSSPEAKQLIANAETNGDEVVVQAPANGDYPDTVPPLENAPVAKPETARQAPRLFAQSNLVTLNFDDTDVTQVLKALAMESGENIIIAPEVSRSGQPDAGGEGEEAEATETGPRRITVSLTEVTVTEALDFICALSGLSYLETSRGYVVTLAELMPNTARQLANYVGERSEVRVVNLRSGEGNQIRTLIYSWFGNQPFEIKLPSEMGITTQTDVEQETGDGITRTSVSREIQDFYVVILGEEEWVNRAADLVEELDEEIFQATLKGLLSEDDIATVAESSFVTENYVVQSAAGVEPSTALDSNGNPVVVNAGLSPAESLVDKVATSFDRVKFIPSPQGSDRQAIVLRGPEGEVVKAVNMLEAIDSGDFLVDSENVNTEIIDLNYIDPLNAQVYLRDNIPNLYVQLLPDPINPRVVTEIEETAGGTESEELELNKTSSSIPMKLLVRGTEEQIDSAKRYLAMVDIEPNQIALELRVLELSEDDALRIGLDWQTLVTGGLFRVNQSTTQTNPNVAGNITANKDDVSATINLDDITNDRNLIARPNALLSDGRTTELFVGDTVRYVETIQATQNGISVVTKEIDTGVIFNIAGRVSESGAIALDLDQRFTILTGFTPVPGGGQIPQTSDRQTKMFVNMRDGETVAIGGLIQEQDVKRVSGVPILKDLPILGWLFKRTENERQRTEVVFFLTAKKVDRGDLPSAASPRANEMIVPDPLQDYRETGSNP
jgi:hypothetical protein